MRLDCNYPIGDVDPLIHSSATPEASRSLHHAIHTKARRRSLQHVDTRPPLLRARLYVYKLMYINARIYASQLVDTLPYIRSDEESLRASRAYIRGWIKEGRRKRRVGSPGPQCLSFARSRVSLFPPFPPFIICSCSIDTHVRLFENISRYFFCLTKSKLYTLLFDIESFLPHMILKIWETLTV